MPKHANPVQIGHGPFGFRAGFSLALLSLAAVVERFDPEVNPGPIAAGGRLLQRQDTPSDKVKQLRDHPSLLESVTVLVGHPPGFVGHGPR